MNRSWQRPLLLLILLVAFALRVWRLDYQELRGDEVFGYFFSLRPLPDIVPATVDLHEPHPVASYYLQHVWLGWAGHSEFALRFTSLWFGVLAVALLAGLGRRLVTPGAALVGALLLAVSPYAIWHSQDAHVQYEFSPHACLHPVDAGVAATPTATVGAGVCGSDLAGPAHALLCRLYPGGTKPLHGGAGALVAAATFDLGELARFAAHSRLFLWTVAAACTDDPPRLWRQR